MKKALTIIVPMMLMVLALSSVVAQDDACFTELEVMTTSDGVEFVRTLDACFENLLDWDYEPQYVEIDGLRQAYVDVGSGESGETVLLLHGQPSWSYLYRKMIPVLAEDGHRVIAMDHLGFGRSDKPIDPDYYSYVGHVERLETFIEELALEGVTIFVQDWGSLIGLQVVGTNSELFDRLVVGNGFLPTYAEGEVVAELPENTELTRNFFHTNAANAPAQQEPLMRDETNQADIDNALIDETFGIWIDYALNDERFRPEQIVESQTYFDLLPEEEAAYAAPFPSRITMGGTRAFPGLVNELGGVTDAGWAGLGEFDKPFLTIWGDNDGGNLGPPSVQQMLIDHIPGSEGWDHVRLEEAGHFLQDDQGEEIAHRINEFILTSGQVQSFNLCPNGNCSLLNYHNGYWVAEIDNPDLPVPLITINDMHVDVQTNRVTVYAQSQIMGQIVTPPQVGPDECTEMLSGDTACFHPNAVYLNGSGEELMESDGTGEWWIKHAWILDGEGYMNCPAVSQEVYDNCFWVEGELLDDGLSMQIGGLEENEGTFNIRTLLLDEDPIAYQLTRYAPANLDSEVGEIDLTPTIQLVLTLHCEEVASPFDNQVRTCPVINP